MCVSAELLHLHQCACTVAVYWRNFICHYSCLFLLFFPLLPPPPPPSLKSQQEQTFIGLRGWWPQTLWLSSQGYKRMNQPENQFV